MVKKAVGKRVLEAAVGVAVGMINGLFGGGGGMLCVPFLEKILGEEVKICHATTVLVIFPVCLAAATVYSATGGVRVPDVFFVMVGAVAGGALGSFALRAAAPKAVSVIFALVVAAAGARMLWTG